MAWESENFISVNTQSNNQIQIYDFSPAHIAIQVVIGEHTIRSDYSVSDDDDYDGIRLKG